MNATIDCARWHSGSTKCDISVEIDLSGSLSGFSVSWPDGWHLVDGEPGDENPFEDEES